MYVAPNLKYIFTVEFHCAFPSDIELVLNCCLGANGNKQAPHSLSITGHHSKDGTPCHLAGKCKISKTVQWTP